MSRPLDVVASIKVKLGAVVAASVVAAALLATLGTRTGVPPLLTVPVAVVLALGVTQLLAAGMVAPLRQMTEVAQRMARGDYSGRVSTQATDEVGRLAVAFNQMAGDLARVEQERRDLIATVSHELRTPLAAMTAVLENLADGVTPADPEHLAGALAQAERLRDLVNDLLDLSRLEGGVAALEPRPTRVRELLEDCVAEVRAAGRPGAHELDVPADLEVGADPGRLRQLVVNLLDNAGRHSTGTRPVRISAGRGAGDWWLEVHDDGPGVPPALRERVFDRFGTDASGGGTGLGLAIARWVAQLHGGTLRFVDPGAGEGGARLRLVLPLDAAPTGTPAGGTPETAPARATAPDDSAPEVVAVGRPQGMDALFGAFWPEPANGDDGGTPSGLGTVLRAAGTGLLAGATMTFVGPGLSWVLVLVAAGATALFSARRRHHAFTLLCAGLALALVLPVMLLHNFAIAWLGVLVAAALFLTGTTGARTVPGIVLTGLSWPLAALRGLPWFGRSLRLVERPGNTSAVVRTLVWSLLGLAVFGSLFASADALFAAWVDAVVPNLTFGDLVTRAFVAVAVFGLTLAAAYLALNPPRVDSGRPKPQPLRNRFEWLVPVLLVDLVFLVFLAAQATVVFAGHDYLERTTGLTYAEHVHQGFGQLTVATALTLLVVWAAARRAGASRADRAWLRGSTGLLLALTLVVVASALHRMQLYQEAYGFTTLRLVVDVFEGWLGVVVLTVAVAGLLGLGRWVPRIALVTGAVAVLGLAVVNPDAWVADRNIDRYESTGRLDLGYLQSLSLDAAPTIEARLPGPLAACALRDHARERQRAAAEDERGWAGWHLARSRAEAVLDRVGEPPGEGTGPGAGDACDALAADLDGALS